jgi:hypothetical protein
MSLSSAKPRPTRYSIFAGERVDVNVVVGEAPKFTKVWRGYFVCRAERDQARHPSSGSALVKPRASHHTSFTFITRLNNLLFSIAWILYKGLDCPLNSFRVRCCGISDKMADKDKLAKYRTEIQQVSNLLYLTVVVFHLLASLLSLFDHRKRWFRDAGMVKCPPWLDP